jgi:alpha-amylase/alpha-mannosidase (GH57 family)
MRPARSLSPLALFALTLLLAGPLGCASEAPDGPGPGADADGGDDLQGDAPDLLGDTPTDGPGDVADTGDAADTFDAADTLDDADVVDEVPRVVNAFSENGLDIVVRFSEPMDPATTEVPANFAVQGSDASSLPVRAVRLDGRFAFLGLDLSGTSINPALTYEVVVRNATDLTGNVIDPQHNRARVNRPLYLAIIWHQHQPLYLDPVRDMLSGPWVRKHATKDYWDMTAIVRDYEGIHMTVNLTSVLLVQNQLYVDRLGPYLDPINNTIDEAGYFAAWGGRTDPFVDLLLRDTPTRQAATEEQLGLFYADPWATVSTSDPIMQRFPEYIALRDMNRDMYDQMEFAYLKVFFEVAWFDPDFLNGPVPLTNGWTVDLTDVVDRQPNGTYLLNPYYTSAAPDNATRLARLEVLANRLLAENVKIMTDVVPLHRSLLYDPLTREGSVEVVTTPFYHPILPLLVNTDLARHAQPTDLLPSPPFSFPDDAFAQVALARRFYEETFEQPLYGMWPAEGSVAEEIVGLLAENGIQWIATDQRVLERSTPPGQPHWYPYQVDADTVVGSGGSTDDSVMIVFRDGPLSDNIGFLYQTWRGEDAANDFMANVLAQAPRFGQPDRLLTVILDGENAWELYRQEHDGKGFLHALYRQLQESQEVGELVTVTPSEYIHGNLDRGVTAHPIAEQRELEPLWRGSWIDASYATWIGESEENLAWNYLLQARTDLDRSGLPRPNPLSPPPPASDAEGTAIWNAWQSMYAAQGSDWFWWYGDDQTSASNDDTPFDRGFRSQLNGMYAFMNEALLLRGEDPFPVPDFAPIIQPRATTMRGPFDPAPVINGRFEPDETEWSAVGGSFYDNDSGGTIASRNDDIALVYYGYDRRPAAPAEEAVYIALLFNEDLSAKLNSNYVVRVFTNYKHILDVGLGTYEPNPPLLNTQSPDGVPLNFVGGGAGWMLELDFSGATVQVRLSQANGSGGWVSRPLGGIQLGGPVPGGRILELRLPWSALGMAFGDPFEFLITASEGTTLIDQAPQLESQVLFDDATNLVIVVFEVDVSGEPVVVGVDREGNPIVVQIPIDTWVEIRTPPPPTGSGIVYITGNQDQLGNWYPNLLALRDDGQSPDRVAGDRIWTRSFSFRPGLLLHWKYTIGTPSDEGRWPNTEEFPLTERGYTLPGAPTTVVLREIFADRPASSGSKAPYTRIVLGE